MNKKVLVFYRLQITEVVIPSYHRKKAVGKRDADLAGLPARIIEHTLSEEELAARFPDGYKELPEEIYKRLHIIPETFIVDEHHVHVYASRNNDGTILKAPRPKDLFRNSIATPALVASIINGKYTNALPLERQAKAFKTNALGARNLSIVARKVEAKLVHISTDDVFDGKSQKPYTEFDETHPKTAYGKSKLAGERYVKEFTYKHFIIRSTWVYGLGDNFINQLLEKVDQGENLSIAGDQFGSPTSAKELARFILHLIQTNEYGTYHATNKGVCSRFEFASEILRLTGKQVEMKPVVTHMSDFSRERPAFSVLDNFIMSMTPVYDFPDWKESLKEYMEERGLLNEK